MKSGFKAACLLRPPCLNLGTCRVVPGQWGSDHLSHPSRQKAPPCGTDTAHTFSTRSLSAVNLFAYKRFCLVGWFLPLPPLFVQLQFRLPGRRPLMGSEVCPFSALDEVALGECGSLTGAFHIAGLPKDHSPDSQESRVSVGSDSRSPTATSSY